MFQIQPIWIYRFYQLILPLSFEMLYLLFTDNSLSDIRERFIINKLITIVFSCKLRTISF